MSGALRIDSSRLGHPTGVFFGCLVAVLIAISTCTNSQAEENSVFISITGPDLQEGQTRQDYEELSFLIKESFENALWSQHYEIAEASDDANYHINLNIRGPFKKCRWLVRCDWTKKNDANTLNKCWQPSLMVSYCSESFQNDYEQIRCLGGIVDFNDQGHPPAPPRNLCEKKQYKVVLATCFDVFIDDPKWQEKLTRMIPWIPKEIEAQLDSELKKRGYNIEPASCEENSDKPQKVDYEIDGSVNQRSNPEKIYVHLIVDERNELAQPDDILNKITGDTPEVSRDHYEKLVEVIVEHIRKHCLDSRQ
jgi:hypothetical protein